MALIPLPACVSLSVKDVALLPLTVITPLAVSVIAADPPPLAVTVRLVAVVEAMPIPPAAPDVTVNAAVFSPVVVSVDDTFPLTADSVIDDDAV